MARYRRGLSARAAAPRSGRHREAVRRAFRLSPTVTGADPKSEERDRWLHAATRLSMARCTHRSRTYGAREGRGLRAVWLRAGRTEQGHRDRVRDDRLPEADGQQPPSAPAEPRWSARAPRGALCRTG